MSLDIYTLAQLHSTGLQAACRFGGAAHLGWIMGASLFVSHVRSRQLTVPINEVSDLQRKLWDAENACATDRAFHLYQQVLESQEWGKHALPAFCHPHCDLTLTHTIKLAQQEARMFGLPNPNSLEDVRSQFKRAFQNAGFVWITGMAALDLLDAVIDGKDIRKHARV